jgi:hypothetical protein
VHSKILGALIKKGRVNCLNQFISSNRLHFVGIQETKKSKFDEGLLNATSRAGIRLGILFLLEEVLGGILVGFKNLVLVVVSWDIF